MKNFIWIVMVLFTTKLSAQSSYVFRDAELTTGNGSKLKHTVDNGTTNLTDEVVLYQLRHEKLGYLRTNKTPILASYDFKTMNLIERQELTLPYQNKKLDFLHINLWGGELVVFSSFYNKKTNIKYVFMQTIDKKTLLPNNDLKKVGEITNVRNRNQARLSKIQIRYAPDSSKVAVTFEGIRGTSESETLNMTIIDINRNILWSKAIELPYKEKKFEVTDFFLNSNGDIFFLGKYDTVEQSKLKYDYKIISYNNSGVQMEYAINLKDKFIRQLNITSVSKNVLVCAGFYNNKIDRNQSGAFYASLDLNDKKFIKESYREFDTEALSEVMTEKELNKHEKRKKQGRLTNISDYTFRGITRRSDNSAVLVGEQFHAQRVTTPTSKGVQSSSTDYYVYNNIIAINITPSGDMDWVRFIRKDQTSTDDNGRYSSYAFMLYKDKMYFIFNDNVNNIPYVKNKETDDAWFSGKSHALSVATLDAKGNQERFELSRYENDKRMFLAKSSGQITVKDAILTRIDHTGKAKIVLQRLTFK